MVGRNADREDRGAVAIDLLSRPADIAAVPGSARFVEGRYRLLAGARTVFAADDSSLCGDGVGAQQIRRFVLEDLLTTHIG